MAQRRGWRIHAARRRDAVPHGAVLGATIVSCPLLASFILFTVACGGGTTHDADAETTAAAGDIGPAAASMDSARGATMSNGTFTIQSPAFGERQEIPATYTCEGRDVSPPLQWAGEPPGTRSFALIVDDPDAPDPKKPQRTWVHWVVYDVPSNVHSLAEGAGGKDAPAGARAGNNDWKRGAWGGPCPPTGRHRYFFKLYALDTVLEGLDHPSKAQLEAAMQGHVLAEAQLVGLYQKKKGS
ncbi:MAG TPA: YbhB/YbcL family Raf kinase inhibitor-like protein [Gemmatimonadaceae bacterium]|nr:YbhB/YbcL family Raf kinase inhibitor-like protein [Gemmatimonadaceae bacterium]